MSQEFISLDERLNRLKSNSTEKLNMLFESIGKLNVKDFSYYNEKGKYNQDTVLAESVLNDTQLDGEKADVLIVEDYFFIMTRAICNAKEAEFWAEKEGNEPDYTRQVYLRLFLRTLIDSSKNNDLIGKMMELKLKDIGRYAFMCCCNGNEEILEKVEKIQNFNWEVGDISDLESSSEINQFHTKYLILMSNRDITLGELSKELERAIDTPWYPTESFVDYKEKMLQAYDKIYQEIILRLLEIFRRGNKFDDIAKKYEK